MSTIGKPIGGGNHGAHCGKRTGTAITGYIITRVDVHPLLFEKSRDSRHEHASCCTVWDGGLRDDRVIKTKRSINCCMGIVKQKRMCHDYDAILGLSFAFVLLIQHAKCIELYSFFFFHHYFTTVNTFPRIKIEKMVKKCLKDHKTITLDTFHRTSRFHGFPSRQLYRRGSTIVNEKYL